MSTNGKHILQIKNYLHEAQNHLPLQINKTFIAICRITATITVINKIFVGSSAEGSTTKNAIADPNIIISKNNMTGFIYIKNI